MFVFCRTFRNFLKLRKVNNSYYSMNESRSYFSGAIVVYSFVRIDSNENVKPPWCSLQILFSGFGVRYYGKLIVNLI